MTWQVSENGQVLSTQTTDSFVFPYVQAGVYTISLTVTDANGDTVSASTAVTVNSPAASATLINEDTKTQGNWIGVYGSQDHDVVGNASIFHCLCHGYTCRRGDHYVGWQHDRSEGP